jgi:V/A-type H+-transporting ATPase subunit I
MFYSQAMTEVELVVPAKNLLAVTDELAGQGVFHQIDTSYMSSEKGPDSALSWQQKAAAYATLERRLLATMQVLNVAQGTPPPADELTMIELEVVRPLIEQIEKEAQTASERRATHQKRLEQLESYLRQLEPLVDIDLDFSTLRHPRYIFSMLGVIPAANLERLQTSLARTPFVLLTLRKDSAKPVVWLAGAKRDADILERAARSAYLNPLDLPHIHHGTPSEIIKSLETAIERARQHLVEQEAEIKALHEAHQQQLHLLLWRVRASWMLTEAIAHFGELRHTYLIVGWVPASRMADLTQRLKQASEEILIDAKPTQRNSDRQNVPVALYNSGILSAFQLLVTTYAQPRYEEVDPALLVALTFPLLYGAMFGDVGHGLMLALLGWLAGSRKVQALRSMANLSTIIMACGLMATVFGFLYGSVFGKENLLPALWIRPIDNMMEILLVAIGLGIVLLSAGFLLNILNAGVARDWGRLFFDHNGMAGFVLYWSMLGLGAGAFIHSFPIPPVVFVIPAVGAGLLVMFSEVLKNLVEKHRPLVEGGPGTYAIQAIFELFETLISFLSNSLSYVRVGAFAVAHAGLSAVIFILANMAGSTHSVGYWIVLLLGQLFIVGFEGLIVGIQTMRLEYYEFFSKFFSGGGMRYKPLTLLPRADEQSGEPASAGGGNG